MRFKKQNRWRNATEKRKYITWRRIVFTLNKVKYGYSKHYICMKCGKRRKTTRTMHAHHHYSWHHFPDKRYDKQNGVVLCVTCHNTFHQKYQFKAIKDPRCLNEYLSKS